VVLKAKLSRLRACRFSSVRKSRPAEIAASSGRRGESPCAMRSAFYEMDDAGFLLEKFAGEGGFTSAVGAGDDDAERSMG
jgi:hypothetical protein